MLVPTVHSIICRIRELRGVGTIAMKYTKSDRDRLQKLVDMQRSGTMRTFELPPGGYVDTTAISLAHNERTLAAIDRYLSQQGATPGA